MSWMHSRGALHGVTRNHDPQPPPSSCPLQGGGLAGLVLVEAIGIAGFLKALVRFAADAESKLNSVEREKRASPEEGVRARGRPLRRV